MWKASVWNTAIALELELDRGQGPFLLFAKVSESGEPECGPYVDASGQPVRLHAGVALARSDPALARDVRLLLADWPAPNLEDGDWDELTSACAQLWTLVQDRSWNDLLGSGNADP